MTTNLTNNEQIVLESITKICNEDYSADVEDIATETGLSMPSVKGVVGSLVKKHLVSCESEERAGKVWYDIFPLDSDNRIFSNGEWN